MFIYNFSVREEGLHGVLMSKSRWGSQIIQHFWWSDFNVNGAFCKYLQYVFFMTRDKLLQIIIAKASTQSKNAVWKLTV